MYFQSFTKQTIINCIHHEQMQVGRVTVSPVCVATDSASTAGGMFGCCRGDAILMPASVSLGCLNLFSQGQEKTEQKKKKPKTLHNFSLCSQLGQRTQPCLIKARKTLPISLSEAWRAVVFGDGQIQKQKTVIPAEYERWAWGEVKLETLLQGEAAGEDLRPLRDWVPSVTYPWRSRVRTCELEYSSSVSRPRGTDASSRQSIRRWTKIVQVC